MTAASTETISFDELVDLLTATLMSAGASERVARVIATNCASCERDGALSHGVFRIPGYLKSLRTGWASQDGDPIITRVGPSIIRANAVRGFAQVALETAKPAITEAIAESGVAVVAIHDAHHFSALWPDLEPFARKGLLGITMVTGVAQVIPRGAHDRILGTNPFAFSTPVAGADPIVMDFATAAMSHGDVTLHMREGKAVPLGTGTGIGGRDTEDPAEILEHGGLLPFGGHKGLALSMMVELLASGFTNSPYSFDFERNSPENPDDGGTDITGQFLMLIDPDRGETGSFAERAKVLIDMMRESGLDRMPADRRYLNRARALAEGIPVTPAIAELRAARSS